MTTNLADLVEDLHGPFCTCASTSEVHEGHCDLWVNYSWTQGDLIWTGEMLAPWDDSLWPGIDALSAESDEDDRYECTCFDRENLTVTVDSRHDDSCELWQHKGWAQASADWDHLSRSFVWRVEPSMTTLTTGFDDWDHRPSTPLCDHKGHPVVFPDSTTVLTRSKLGSWKDRPTDQPDLALYLDTSWEPRGLAVMLPWRDYGLPEIPFDVAAETIRFVFERARGGEYVEIGCIGAHGRTGTVLACMAVLAGVPASDAVAWVKEHYCERAVEDIDQRWWVQWFDCHLRGVEAPPRPERPPTLKTTLSKPVRFEAGDRCPKDRSHKLVRVGPTLLRCASKRCVLAAGLPACPVCGAVGDPDERYLCPDPTCSEYGTVRGSPRADRLIVAK